MRPPLWGWLLLSYGVLATTAMAFGSCAWIRYARAEAALVAFTDSVRVELSTKQCVYMPFVPRDTIRRGQE